MKRLIIALIALLLCLLAFAACDIGSNDRDTESNTETTESDTETTESNTETEESTVETTESATETTESDTETAESDTETTESDIETTESDTEATESNTETTESNTETEESTEPPHAHDFGEWNVTQAPTCTEKGQQERSCSCGEKETEKIDALGHTEVIDEAKAPTCSELGFTEGKHCSVCNTVIVAQTAIPTIDHTMVMDAAKDPDCTETGLTMGIHCSVCNKVLMAQETIPALGHDEAHHNAKAPTCTAIGWDAYETCSRCNYTTYEEKTALGHDKVSHDAKAPTCTDIGWDAYETCSRCNYTTYAEKAALCHDKVNHDAKAPTCTDIGWDAYETCSRCNYTTYKEKAALGHDKVNHDAKAPTCTDIGWDAYETCSRCNYTTYEEKAALGHTEVKDAAVAATCTAEGKTEGSHCSVCNTTIVAQAAIEKLSHNYVNETIIKNATCVAKGSKKLKCENCSAYITQEYELEKFAATDINKQALNYVGEIIVYDKQGKELGLATGFVYSRDGKIITNYHVIEDAYSAKITINGKSYQITQVLAYDSNIDLAVLKVNSTFNTYAKICKNPIEVGSTVYAIGSSRGMTNTFSQGIVTYYDRVVDGVSHLQHDASITNGNSGGPLINEYGEVVGINTWGITNSQNLNFAVFTKELDNLKFGTPMTMAEFYESLLDPYEVLEEWILENYNHKGNTYISFDYEVQVSTYYVISVNYYESDFLTVSSYYVFEDGSSAFFSLTLSENSKSCYYECIYRNSNSSVKNTMEGYINANNFTSKSSLSNYSYKGNNKYKEYIVEYLAPKQTKDAVNWFDWALSYYGIGLTIEDFGFTSFN